MTTVHLKPSITASDRLSLTLFLAVTLHVLIILGISFSSDDAGKKPDIINTLDITLVQTRSETPPEKPDYIAQADQQGGGNTKEKIRIKSPKSDESIVAMQGTAETTKPMASPKATQSGIKNVLTLKKGELKVSKIIKTPKAAIKSSSSTAQLMRRSKELARLSALNEESWLAYSRKPDSKYIYANTRKHKDAAYLSYWSQKVEEIGNLNYPDEARRKKMTGNLIMEVSLRPDGSLIGIKILRSSQYKILDDAAKSIVRLAAPFSKVPADVLEDRKTLKIVRTWAFTSGNKLYSR